MPQIEIPRAFLLDTARQTSKIGLKQMSFSVSPNLLFQWAYCPRKVYYAKLTNLKVSLPDWVRQGREFHAQETQFWKRRNYSRFGLEDGESYYNLSIESDKLEMHGILDMAIQTDQAVFPVEFKISAYKRKGDILQLVAYAMLLEEHFDKPCKHGFFIGDEKVLHCIEITPQRRKEVQMTLSLIRSMLLKGRKPESSASIAQCNSCEYLNFCNDR